MEEILHFLSRLKKNNHRDWFEAHRDEYESVRDQMKSLVSRFINDLSAVDPSIQGLIPSKCLFRLNRDIRFSKNKSPYKTNMGAFMNPGGKKTASAGYYIHIEPSGSFLAGGIWMPPAEELRKIRQEIDYNGQDLKAVLSDKKFRSVFGSLDPEHSLKTAPKGYAKDHPDIELIRHTSFICWKGYGDKEVVSKRFPERLVRDAVLVHPLNRFLNTALD